MDSGVARDGRVSETDARAGTAHDDGDQASINCTELGNARRLVAAHGEDLRYCYAWGKWLIWDERRWEIDDSGNAERRAKDVVTDILTEALNEKGSDRRSVLMRWALESEKRKTIEATLALARSEVTMSVKPAEMDANPYRLNCQNGTLNLHTGELDPHRREDRITKLAPVDYDPSAECPRWLAFLGQIFGGDETLIRFLQRAAGYALTGDTGERVIFVFWGSGGNGKSTLLEVLRAALGDYALRTPTETLLAKKEGGVPNDVARLRGARLVTASETEDGKRFSEAFIKDLTGGDTISARFMRAEWFDFKPECKVFLGTNHKPVIKGTDNAIWDRLRLVPFAVTIPMEQRDKGLRERLMAELPGILTWAVQGCLEWQEEGLGMPSAVSAATATYRSEMDVLGAFFEDRCLIANGVRASAGELYKAYTDWCEKNGERGVMAQRGFGLRLVERGFSAVKGTGGRREWVGVGLLASEAADSGASGASGATFDGPPRVHEAPSTFAPLAPPSATESHSQIQNHSNNGHFSGVCLSDGCEQPVIGQWSWCKAHLADRAVTGEVRLQ